MIWALALLFVVCFLLALGLVSSLIVGLIYLCVEHPKVLIPIVSVLGLIGLTIVVHHILVSTLVIR